MVKKNLSLNRRNGTILGGGSWRWPRSSRSWKAPRRDIGISGDRGTGAEASGGSVTEAVVGASGDSAEEAAATVADSRTKGRSGVSTRPSASEPWAEGWKSCVHRLNMDFFLQRKKR